jgi:NADH-quinone oxidoreductase subunit K
MIGLTHFLVLASALFCLGALGVIMRRSLIAVLMSVELMLGGGNIAFASFARFSAGEDGQVAALVVMALAAAEAAVGLALAIAYFRLSGTISLDKASDLKN